ncbi:MAG: hypothetical protein EHM70_08790 [Chloroflexota bacterium]|nr:MAG: hypothetical protein EHM70_08790 [Chloroflexota bacterium]
MIHIKDNQFFEGEGRIVQLRGVNLSGSSKVPVRPNGATWNRNGFYDTKNISFVGRPFPVEEAGEHFERLKAWGFTFIRFLVTWEAIEHEGPGIYDQAYLDYLYKIVQKAGEYGLSLFIDPHQDVWSRFTGGDGAPGWTLEAVGMDVTRLHAAGAAILHQEHGDPFPRMIWPTNYGKLAAATLFTLFFGGNDFAPRLRIEGVPVQEYLQSHYINAVKQVALCLKDFPHVTGYDTLNEPSAGFIGAADVGGQGKGPLLLGDSPTIFQSMLLGYGYLQAVDVYKMGPAGSKKCGTRLANTQGVNIWRAGYNDVWKEHGVWGIGQYGQPQVLIRDYFCKVGGRPVDFNRDYFKPFANRFAREIRSVVPEAIIFVEGVPTEYDLTWGAEDEPGVVHAAHWYDGLTLLTKKYTGWLTFDIRDQKIQLGAKRVRQCFADQIAEIVHKTGEKMGQAAVLVGEVGIPFDMQAKRAYRTGNFSMQTRALDATMSALEKNFVSFTLWNYTPENSNARGDQWNDEDLSIFSRDQMTGSGSIHDGGRALKAAVRPYPCKLAGEPTRVSFNIHTGVYELTFRHFAGVSAPTEIFIPDIHYPNGCAVEVSDGSFEIEDGSHILSYRHTAARPEHTLRLKPKKSDR